MQRKLSIGKLAKTKFFLVGMVALAAVFPLSKGLAQLDAFPMKTLRQAMQEFPDGGTLSTTSAKPPALQVLARYTGESREIESEKRNFLNRYSTSMRQEEFISKYKKEIHVRTERDSIWIPIQDTVLPFLEKELNKGGQIKLYLRHLGYEKRLPIFVLIDFSTKK